MTPTVLITGAAGNLGRAVAHAFAERGANLVLVDLELQALKTAFGADDERRLIVPANLLDQASVDAAVKKAIERFGRIDVLCNIAEDAAQKGAAAMGAYVASKSAVIRITETMAAELREKNINVNCVLPTIIDTPENRAAMPKADPRRWVAPQDLAAVIVFLASDAARAVHGAAIPVTGLS